MCHGKGHAALVLLRRHVLRGVDVGAAAVDLRREGNVFVCGVVDLRRVLLTRSDARCTMMGFDSTARTHMGNRTSAARAPSRAKNTRHLAATPGSPALRPWHTSHVEELRCTCRAWPPPCDLVSEFVDGWLACLFTCSFLQPTQPDRLDTPICPPPWHHKPTLAAALPRRRRCHSPHRPFRQAHHAIAPLRPVLIATPPFCPQPTPSLVYPHPAPWLS
jgi:hypothetical protein